MVRNGKTFDESKAATDPGPAASPAALAEAIQQVITANPAKLAEYKAGKKGLVGFFVGQVVRLAPGADPKQIKDEVLSRLDG